jgi:hypothetical protein
MTTSLHFPPNIAACTFSLNDEFAWQKKDLPQVYKYCEQAKIAILYGEAWVVRLVADCGPNDPTLPRHSIDPRYEGRGSVLGRTATHVIYGILPCRDGSNGVFSWDCDSRQQRQTWQTYVKATLAETERIINNFAVESKVIEDYSPFVYYNLALQPEDEALHNAGKSYSILSAIRKFLLDR